MVLEYLREDKIKSKIVHLTVYSLSLLLLATRVSFCVPEVSSTCRNNTNLFTRFSNAKDWRVEGGDKQKPY